MNKRKVCVVVASRANYGRVKSVLAAINKHPSLELQLIVGASALLDRFGNAVKVIEEDGFVVSKKIFYIVEGDTLLTQAKSTGLGIVELSTAFDELKPDVVVTVADRFETMSTALAATYMNIPLAHIQGGEISGNIDDKVRHAISKLADFHFVGTDLSAKRLALMGEYDASIFNYGCPAMDIIKNTTLSIDNDCMRKYTGVGASIDFEQPYLLMIQHPVTTSYGDGFGQISETLHALKSFKNHQKIVLWPNSDAGSDDVSKGIRMFRESEKLNGFHFYKNFTPEDFIKVLANAKCAIGNSSSFLREGEYLNTPSVMVGDRQLDREYGDNVAFSDYNRELIAMKVNDQLNSHHTRTSGSIYGSGNAGSLIAERLALVELGKIKRLNI